MRGSELQEVPAKKTGMNRRCPNSSKELSCSLEAQGHTGLEDAGFTLKAEVSWANVSDRGEKQLRGELFSHLTHSRLCVAHHHIETPRGTS